jgi:hypothetical protein
VAVEGVLAWLVEAAEAVEVAEVAEEGVDGAGEVAGLAEFAAAMGEGGGEAADLVGGGGIEFGEELGGGEQFLEGGAGGELLELRMRSSARSSRGLRAAWIMARPSRISLRSKKERPPTRV